MKENILLGVSIFLMGACGIGACICAYNCDKEWHETHRVESKHYQDVGVVTYHEQEIETSRSMNGRYVYTDVDYVTVVTYGGVQHTYWDENFYRTYSKGDEVVIDVRTDYIYEIYEDGTEKLTGTRTDFSLASEDRRKKK